MCMPEKNKHLRKTNSSKKKIVSRDILTKLCYIYGTTKITKSLHSKGMQNGALHLFTQLRYITNYRSPFHLQQLFSKKMSKQRINVNVC